MWYIMHYNDEYGDNAIIESIDLPQDLSSNKNADVLKNALLKHIASRIAGLCSCDEKIAASAVRKYMEMDYDGDYWEGNASIKPPDEIGDIIYNVTMEPGSLSAEIEYANHQDMISAYWYEPEPDTQKTAYQRGFLAGTKTGDERTWDAARKIFADVSQGGLPLDDISEIFGDMSCPDIFRHYAVSEVLEKISAYVEQKKKEETLHRGDEVMSTYGDTKAKKAVILNTNPKGSQAQVYDSHGKVEWWSKSSFFKTGITYAEINDVLKKIQEGHEEE